MSDLLESCEAGPEAAPAPHANDSLVTVVRHLAHELNRPLRTIESIACYLEMILPRSEGKARRQLTALQREVQQANWILADAIHFLGAAPAHFDLLNLTELVARSIAEWPSEQRQMVSVSLQEDIPLIRADLEQVSHLLRAVVSCLLRVSHPDAVLEVRTSATLEEVRLNIRTPRPRDSVAQMEKFFEPFESRFPEGSGLALASVRRIADLHGARLEVRPDSSAGISVRVSFPTVNGTAGELPKPQPPAI